MCKVTAYLPEFGYICNHKNAIVMEISHAIKYAGVDDTDLDLFENQYPLTHGMAYNSYIILDDKIAITDTVDIRCGDEWLRPGSTASLQVVSPTI